MHQLDYLAFIDTHERINAFHVKDAEFNLNGRQCVYSGYSNRVERAGRFRSLGDGQINFKAIFSYWLIPVALIRNFVATTCRSGVYGFNVMPFGVKNASAVFQNL